MTSIKISAVFAILCFISLGKSWATQVHIWGFAPEYKNNIIELYVLHDIVTEEKVKLGAIKFSSEGKFDLNVELAATNLAMADFDGYHGMFYIEPGKSYEIVFPPKRNLTDAQKRNPFVKPDPVWFGLKNSTKAELNYQIQRFEQEYTLLENKYFDQIYTTQSKNLVDTVKQSLDHLFPKTDLVLFESHKLFRKANLDFALNQGKSKEFMQTYFEKTKPVYVLGAYAIAFNQTFNNYFEKLYTATGSKKFKEIIGSVNLQKLDDFFQKELNFNKELSHLVLLKSLYDAYYSKQFSKTSVLNLLNQVKSPDWTEYEQQIAKLTEAKLTYLSSGTNPPAIVLKDLNGQKVDFSDYKNKYIYLHFTDPKNLICRQHLDALKTTANLYKEKLVIINVIPDGKNFKNVNGWGGIFTTSETNIEASYKVKTFPNSFLIGKDGRLLLSPAPNPIDGFDRQMGQILKSDYFKDLQKANNQPTK
ncbi:MAG TPA: hypothetical protein PKO30_04710 [Prolixibacteraceae bacterium]|nr:hypothetical protein [Prolixibacteraceae bacterium]